MNTMSESRADTPSGAAPAPASPVLVWDAPVRVFHWLMVLGFAGAWLTAESERWRLVHVTLGWTMVGLVAFRILWGLVGTRYARFSSFVRGPAAVAAHVRQMVRGTPAPHTGHNPAGAVAIVVLLGLTLVVGATGWAVFDNAGGEWLEQAHEIAANAMLLVVGAHIAGVVLGSWLQRENLVRAMITGRKSGRPGDGARSAWRSVAILMLVAVLGFWWLQWHGAPASGPAGPLSTSATVRDRDGDDD